MGENRGRVIKEYYIKDTWTKSKVIGSRVGGSNG